MIVSCSQCNARYLVPAVHFAGGPRMVRCGRCANTWRAALPQEPAEMLAVQLSALGPADQASLPAPPPVSPALPVIHDERRHFWVRHWPVIGLAFVAAASLLWLALNRVSIVESWPVMGRVYDRVGLHVYQAGEGLGITQVHSEMRFEDGIMQLAVEGQIANQTAKDQPIPDLMADAIGPDGAVMQSWQIDAPKAKVGAGEAVAFGSSITAPKGTVVEINLHFVEPKHGT